MSLREKILIAIFILVLLVSLTTVIRQHIAIYGLFCSMTNFIRG